MRTYKVLLVDLAKAFGGAEVRIITQAQTLQDQVQRCAVAVLKDSPLHQRLQSDGLPHEAIDVGRGSPQMILKLRQIMQQGGYQVVDAHNVHSIMWAHWAALLAGAKGRVATIHSDYGKEYPGTKGYFYESVLWQNRLYTHEYITVTEVLQEKYTRYAPRLHSTLIHNAVPIPAEPIQPKNPVLIHKWGFSSEDFIVAIVGRLVPVKGHSYLLNAIAQLQDLPQVKLLIVGDEPLRGELEALTQQLNLTSRVHFTGFQQNIPKILQSVDAVCMASLSEAMPFAVLEAGSYARPLLSTKVGGLATLLQDHETALLVPSQDATALANGLRELVNQPDQTQRLGNTIYEMVKNSFSTEVMIGKILQVYDRVAV